MWCASAIAGCDRRRYGDKGWLSNAPLNTDIDKKISRYEGQGFLMHHST